MSCNVQFSDADFHLKATQQKGLRANIGDRSVIGSYNNVGIVKCEVQTFNVTEEVFVRAN